MPELSTETLPLLPLTSGVVLPGMVVTATLETPESRSAASAANDTGGHLLLVPKVDGRYATVGTVAKIENAGELPNGQLAVVVRGLHRARIGAGVAGTGTATWVEVEPTADPPATERAMSLAREYRAVVENILEARGAGGRSWAGRVTPWARGPARRRSARTSPRAWRSHSASSSSASRWAPSARSSARARTARTSSTPTGPRSPRARCPRASGPPSSARSAGWSGPASRAPSTAGSGPGSTP